MSTLLDILLTEHLLDTFRDAGRKNPAINAVLAPDPSGDADILGDGGAAVQIRTEAGSDLLLTARSITRVGSAGPREEMPLEELVGYDWISRDLSEKVRLQAEHGDRVYLILRDAREVVLDGLGASVFPLMAYLGKVLELRSQKVLLRQMSAEVVGLVTRCLKAAVSGPFFTDDELGDLFEQDRASLQIVAEMWSRMNLASPELGRTVIGVMEMLLQRREAHEEAWAAWVEASPTEVEEALVAFDTAVSQRSG